MSDAYTTIRYETTPDHVATITLDRPDALNAFDRRMCEEIRSAWQRIKGDPAVNAVVLRGGRLITSSQERNAGASPLTDRTWKKKPCRWKGWSINDVFWMSQT